MRRSTLVEIKVVPHTKTVKKATMWPEKSDLKCISSKPPKSSDLICGKNSFVEETVHLVLYKLCNLLFLEYKP